MSAMLPQRPHSLKTPQMSPSLRGEHHPVMADPGLVQPEFPIKGDTRLCVTESEAALHPITGHYSIETTGMQEPLYTLWHAEGQVLYRQARSTNIAFDVRGARAGETRTYLVAVQVVESGVRGRVVQSGVFVRVVVRGDESAATRDVLVPECIEYDEY